jgi:BMFP domain-containing protein YqiC
MKDVSRGIRFSPLKYHFQKILTSEFSATTICQVSSVFACQTVMVDLLRAVIECWIVFVTETLLQTSPYVLEQDTRSRAYNTDALNHISKVSRDISLLFQFTMDTLLLTLEDNDVVSRTKLGSIGIESRAKLHRLQHRIDDLVSNLNSVLEVKKTLVEESQTQSVKRLTMIAAIFLPLGLASSLLSMQTRVVDLGVLWYDYFGICFLLFFVGVNLYQVARMWDVVKLVRATKTAAYLDMLRSRISRKTYNTLHAMFMSIIQPIFSGTSGLKWKILRGFLHNGFLVALVSSFCIGMFKSLSLAWKIAAYGAAGWAVGLFLLYLAIFLINIYNLKHLRVRKADS